MTCRYCEAEVLAVGLCSKHYNRQWRTGHPLGRRHRKVPGRIILTEPHTKRVVYLDAL